MTYTKNHIVVTGHLKLYSERTPANVLLCCLSHQLHFGHSNRLTAAASTMSTIPQATSDVPVIYHLYNTQLDRSYQAQCHWISPKGTCGPMHRHAVWEMYRNVAEETYGNVSLCLFSSVLFVSCGFICISSESQQGSQHPWLQILEFWPVLVYHITSGCHLCTMYLRKVFSANIWNLVPKSPW